MRRTPTAVVAEVQMATVLLQDYVDPRKRYALDPESGAVIESMVRGDAKDNLSMAGFGVFRTIGLLSNRSRLFVAAYADHDTLWVRIGNEVFDLAERDFEIKRTAPAPFVKRFSISRRGQVLLSLVYFYVDHQVWPDNGDIFTLIERTAATPSAHEGFAYIWRAKKDGRDITSKEFLEELERFRHARSGS